MIIDGIKPQGSLRRLRRHTGFRIASVLLGVIAVCAALPELVTSLSPATSDPTSCSLRAPDGTYQDRLAPSREHWFGTDVQGCDEFARVVFGARTSLTIALAAGLLITIIGTFLGVLAGWRGGWADALVRRSADTTLGVPFVVGAILLLSVLGGERRSELQIILTLAALLWPGAARVARSATRTQVALPFIEAARAAGAGTVRLLVKHVVPNVMPVIVSFATPVVGLLIASEATLAYLGIGLRTPAVSWGLMIDQAQPHYTASPHLLLFPGAFLAATVAGFILLGDAISDILDPHREP